MDTFAAVSIIELEEDATLERTLEAWASLIKSGACWSLQGWYGRNATQLIKSGYISNKGVIDWDTVNAALEDADEYD